MRDNNNGDEACHSSQGIISLRSFDLGESSGGRCRAWLTTLCPEGVERGVEDGRAMITRTKCEQCGSARRRDHSEASATCTKTLRYAVGRSTTKWRARIVAGQSPVIRGHYRRPPEVTGRCFGGCLSSPAWLSLGGGILFPLLPALYHKARYP